MPFLAVENVTVRFGGVRAVDGVSLTAERGQVIGLVGPNGAGKSTLFDVVCGTRTALTGRIVIDGQDVTRLPSHRRARLGLARTFQRLEVFGSLTVRDNVRVAAERERGGGGRRPEDSASVLAQVGLTGHADRTVASLPSPTARFAELARALVTRPALMLLDEPSSGLGAAEVEMLTGIVRRLADENTAVIVVAHDMAFVGAVCDEVHVMHLGRIIASGSPAQVWADPVVRSAYLGSVKAEKPAAGPAAAPSGDPEQPMLGLHGVHAAYERIPVLHGVSIGLRAGEVHALLGPNGSGKSALVRVAGGLLRPTRGWLSLGGHRVGWASAHTLARLGVAMIPERPAVFADLTVAEHLGLVQAHTKSGVDVVAETFATFPTLAQRRHQVAGTLSGGEQQMLALARALAVRPLVLLVDELSSGLAPNVVAAVHARLRDIAAQGSAVLLAEQFVAEALSISDVVTLLRAGQTVYAGPPGELRGKLMQAYVG